MYRNLTKEQFDLIKDATKKVCEHEGLVTIGEFKVIANLIIDKIENKTLGWGDLLQEKIPFKLPDDFDELTKWLIKP